MQPKYQIGDAVWVSSWDASENFVTCPDCGGTGRLRVTFHDETTASIHCRNCSAGYDPPTGRIKVYDRRAKAESAIVSGIEMDPNKVRYTVSVGVGYRYIYEAGRVFSTEEEARIHAETLAADADREERERIQTKEKDRYSWAWNASYHRREIERCKKEIERHTAKLAVAAIKAKDKAPAPSAPTNKEE